MRLFDNLLVDEFVDDISRMDINGNDSDDFDTGLHRQLTSDTNDEFADTGPDQGQELLHC